MIETLVSLLIVLPLAGALINTFVVRNGRLAGYIASGVVLLAFALGVAATVMLGGLPEDQHHVVDFTLWQWIRAGTLDVPFGFWFDPLAAVMVLLITGVGGLIHVFSIGYMSHDPRPVRYFVYMNLFVTAMLILVLANNYLLLFLGWEGVGLCSYLLIGHNFERKEARYASMKAFVVNRIGDAGMMLAMFALFFFFGTLNFGSIFPRVLELSGQQLGAFAAASAIAFLMLIGVAGKSAQIPLWVWLPDAMAGPTPASALIHAATMVTSGVYLIVRSHAIFALAPGVSQLVAWIGALTAFVAASIAIGQYDIKRVLAFSTVSQLGFMVAAAGMGAWVAAIFHLLTHGVFKALLFLGAGSVIHGTHETQDMRKMGGLRKHMPRTYWTYVIGSLALAGIFPFAGFWSKDEILGSALEGGSLAIFIVLLITAVLTAFYMGRQVVLVFHGQQRDHSYHAHESEGIMTVPLLILAAGAVIVGVINLPGEILGIHLPGSHALDHFLEPVFEATNNVHEAPTFSIAIAVGTVLLAIAAIWVAFQVYGTRSWKKGFRDPLQHYLGFLFEGFEHRWYVDDLYNALIVRPFKGTGAFLSRVFDPRAIDGIVHGTARLVGLSGQGLRQAQTGYVRSYALVFFIGVVAVLGYFGYVAVR